MALWALAALLLVPGCGDAGAPTAPVTLERGAVASSYPLAAEIGRQVLERGGNAVDAAVAVHFALAVCFPNAGNIGGGGFMLIHLPGGGVEALDYRETAPAGAEEALFQDSAGNVVAGLSLHSHLAAGVPGSVRGMWAAHRRYGSRPWAELLEPAIDIAERGFEIDAWSAASLERARAAFKRLPAVYRRLNNFVDYFGVTRGQVLRQPELAATLRRIADEGAADFYEGQTARLIVEEMRRGGGLITLEDLAAYEARWRRPVEGRFRDRRVVSMPPPSSGGIALVEMLNMLEHFPVQRWHSAEQVHLVAEIEKRVFADRAALMGDTDFYPVPVAGLLDEDYAAARAAEIELARKSDPQSIGAGRPRLESTETTHFSVVDRNLMAVSNTTTLNASYGSGIVVRGAGFLLNNEMDDFSAKPGVPNLFGVVGGEANKIEAGKRMLSSMTPTFVFDRQGRLELVLGSPGGPTIFTTVFQVIVNVVDYGMSLEEAVAAPRFHHQWPPPAADRDPIRCESRQGFRLPRASLAGLRRMGYAIEEVREIGDVQAVGLRRGRALAVSDPRRVGGLRLSAVP
ncbi:MAG: gamma-glutamyltransferase [Acidobacteriota bacterium]|nr:gamma-glutamyltransferase [Acidobacteriota bacterium]